MVRTHPRWLGARDADPRGAHRRPARGDGILFVPQRDRRTMSATRPTSAAAGCWTSGFYPVTMSRFLFDAEPVRVMGLCERDPAFGTDRLTSAHPAVSRRPRTFTCSTQLAAHQALDIFGTRGRIAVEIPWSMPADRPSRLLLDDGTSLTKDNLQAVPFAACDQWQVQCDLFCQAIRPAAPRRCPSKTRWRTWTSSTPSSALRSRAAAEIPARPKAEGSAGWTARLRPIALCSGKKCLPRRCSYVRRLDEGMNANAGNRRRDTTMKPHTIKRDRTIQAILSLAFGTIYLGSQASAQTLDDFRSAAAADGVKLIPFKETQSVAATLSPEVERGKNDVKSLDYGVVANQKDNLLKTTRRTRGD